MLGPHATAQPDLVVHDWIEISAGFVGDEPTGALVIGNGLSCAIWDKFAYPSLLDEASADTIAHPLTDADKAIFAALGTNNFESVLEALHKAIVIAQARGDAPGALEEHYQRIRRALVEAVKTVHVPWDWVSEANRKEVGKVMRAHATVYSVSYDLLAYWCVMATGVKQFLDFFFADAHSFDPRWLPPSQGRTRLLFPHGALHLVRRWSGATAKLTNDGRRLLEQFGEEGQSEPLFVSEGTAADKRAALRRSDYLSYAYEQLATDPGPFVLFGVGLGAEDAHIAAALNRKDVPIAIALHGDDPADLLAKAGGYVQSLNRASPLFFKSATHPLGNPALQAAEPEAPIESSAEEVNADFEDLYHELFDED